MVSKDFMDQCVRAFFEEIDNGVVQGILVLLQPGCDVVWDLCWGNVRIRSSFLSNATLNANYVHLQFRRSEHKKSEPQLDQALLVLA